jgi:hypothetical protein
MLFGTAKAMKNAKQRYIERASHRLDDLVGRHIKAVCDEQDFPDFDPARAERLTLAMVAAGQLVIETCPAGINRERR